MTRSLFVWFSWVAPASIGLAGLTPAGAARTCRPSVVRCGTGPRGLDLLAEAVSRVGASLQRSPRKGGQVPIRDHASPKSRQPAENGASDRRKEKPEKLTVRRANDGRPPTGYDCVEHGHRRDVKASEGSEDSEPKCVFAGSNRNQKQREFRCDERQQLTNERHIRHPRRRCARRCRQLRRAHRSPKRAT